ncbi:hypothetical protein [Shewanella sp. VB17]|uniref:hypothetical protein n=1 Tax=Shewanella sp. VB17 TaxID=2739432 RepID=UPI0020B6BD4A|nr:hypothetical protein [Shewanella sp. VB17]
MKVIIAITLFISFSATSQATEKKHITFAFYTDPNTNLYGKWADLIYTDAFSRLGIDFSYVVLPAIRASKMADLGRVDGEGGRIGTYVEQHPNLIRIDEPIVDGSLSAYAHNPAIKIQSWQDIQNSQYKVEYYRGMALAHQLLPKYVPQDRLTNSSTPGESLRKMLRDRIDIYIDSNLLTRELLQTPEFIDKNIKMIAILETTSTYGYLHKRHSELAIKLADVFRQMKSEGKFKDYFQQAKLATEVKDTQP